LQFRTTRRTNVDDLKELLVTHHVILPGQQRRNVGREVLSRLLVEGTHVDSKLVRNSRHPGERPRAKALGGIYCYLPVCRNPLQFRMTRVSWRMIAVPRVGMPVEREVLSRLLVEGTRVDLKLVSNSRHPGERRTGTLKMHLLLLTCLPQPIAVSHDAFHGA
jgi:hypothetical protein